MDTRYSVVEAETALTLHFFSSIDYRYPVEDPAKLSGRVKASACSFRSARTVPGISSGFNVRRQGISKVIESSTSIRRVLKTASLKTDRRPKDLDHEDYVKPTLTQRNRRNHDIQGSSPLIFTFGSGIRTIAISGQRDQYVNSFLDLLSSN